MQKDLKNRILSLDLAENNSGWAIYDIERNQFLDCGVVKTNLLAKTYKERLRITKEKSENLIHQILEIAKVYRPYYIVYEEYFLEPSERGIAATVKGTSYQIIFNNGYLEGCLKYEFKDALIYSVRPSEWKGQVPKSVIFERLKEFSKIMQKKFPKKPFWRCQFPSDHNAVEACMIGQWWFKNVYSLLPEEAKLK